MYRIAFSSQCGRKPDAFKFWLMWKALGDEGLKERVDRCVALADHAVERIKEREAEDGALEVRERTLSAHDAFERRFYE